MKYLFPAFGPLKENALLPAICSKFKHTYKICTCFNTGDLIAMLFCTKKNPKNPQSKKTPPTQTNKTTPTAMTTKTRTNKQVENVALAINDDTFLVAEKYSAFPYSHFEVVH